MLSVAVDGALYIQSRLTMDPVELTVVDVIEVRRMVFLYCSGLATEEA